MNAIRSIAKKIPGLRQVYVGCLNFLHKQRLKGKAPEAVFTEIYKENLWGSNESISGPGSAKEQTRAVVEKLPVLLRELAVTSMLDIPCGDFIWLKNADLGEVNYIGADIVDEIVTENRQTFQKDKISFKKLNLISDLLPKVDLIFCRDCLVHFSFDDIRKALQNICQSGSGYLLTTSFKEHTENFDILTGQWRPLNLELHPFLLPKPICMIVEGCTEGESKYADKSLCLWLIDDILPKIK